MSTRRVWYALSVVMILVSAFSLVFRGLNLGVDFTGGVTVRATFSAAANSDAVVKALQQAGYADPKVTLFGSARDVSIRLPPTKLTTAAVSAQMEQLLHPLDANVQIQAADVVFPQVGGELLKSAWEGAL